MALDAATRLAVFEILGLPVVQPQDFDSNLQTRLWVDNRGGWPEFPYQYEVTAIKAVDDRIATLDADEEERVNDIVAQYQAIQYQTVFVKTDKITLSYDKARARLGTLLRVIFPIRIRNLAGQGSIGNTGGIPGLSVG